MRSGLIAQLIDFLLVAFSLSITLSYLVLAVVALYAIRSYMRRYSLTVYSDLVSSELAPSISVIAPAYNEGPTIVDNIKSMLSLAYNNYDVVVVNDGSKDDTIERVVAAFDLVPVPFFVDEKLKTQKVLSVYKSTNRAFKKLTFVNKLNGGKSDALNAGINVSSSRLVTCIDVDCILENDSLQRMVKPFMENAQVIACGGAVRVANACDVEQGKLVHVHLSEKYLITFQVMEYLRAFLLNRVAWGRLNGLLLISGAFGMFQRKLIIEAGGYSTDTVGEDMELVVRIRRLMDRQRRKFSVYMIPDPLCWTEVPANAATLSRQRRRWARGTVEVLHKHKDMLFNPNNRLAGLFSFPFWMFFEWFAPLLEVFGLAYFMVKLSHTPVSWHFFWLLMSMFYCFSIFLSTVSLYVEQVTFPRYWKSSDLVRLLASAMLEPFIYHPRLTYWSVRGNIEYLRGVKSWGEMKRDGFK